MSKTYRPYEPDQALLVPPALTDWLPEGHLVYFLREAVGELDLSAITDVYEAEERGFPPYHPQMMGAVLLYAYCLGVTSSRKIARRLEEDVAFRVLAANNTRDFRTIAEFRKRHLAALAGLFVQVLRLCQEAGLVKLGHVALDGTRMKANASKHKAMSYERMGREESRLAAEVKALLEQAEDTDERQDAKYRRDKRGDELPAELAFREGRLKKIREAKAALEREAREEAKKREREAPESRAGHPGEQTPDAPARLPIPPRHRTLRRTSLTRRVASCWRRGRSRPSSRAITARLWSTDRARSLWPQTSPRKPMTRSRLFR